VLPCAVIDVREYLTEKFLLGGGTKKRQQDDIHRAQNLWADYRRRKKEEK